jgi:DNA-binding helix-hairpin-helix protein with protein kinase domain
MQQPISPTRDKDMTDYLYSALIDLPGTIGGIEAEQAALVNCKREAQMNLEDAELNATLNAPQDGKNAEARKLEAQAALMKDETVKKFKKEVMRYEAEVEMNEAEAKSKRREFQAAVALAELHSARINAMHRAQKTN